MKYIKFLFLPITLIFLLLLWITKSKIISSIIVAALILWGTYSINDRFSFVEVDLTIITDYFTSEEVDEIQINKKPIEIKLETKKTCEELKGERVFSHKGSKTVINQETGISEEISVDRYNCIIPNLS